MAMAPRAEIEVVVRRFLSADDREKVILELIANTHVFVDPDLREWAYRLWCKQTRSSPLRSDITRIREARPRELQRGLLFEQ